MNSAVVRSDEGRKTNRPSLPKILEFDKTILCKSRCQSLELSRRQVQQCIGVEPNFCVAPRQSLFRSGSTWRIIDPCRDIFLFAIRRFECDSRPSDLSDCAFRALFDGMWSRWSRAGRALHASRPGSNDGYGAGIAMGRGYGQ